MSPKVKVSHTGDKTVEKIIGSHGSETGIHLPTPMVMVAKNMRYDCVLGEVAS